MMIIYSTRSKSINKESMYMAFHLRHLRHWKYSMKKRFNNIWCPGLKTTGRNECQWRLLYRSLSICNMTFVLFTHSYTEYFFIFNIDFKLDTTRGREASQHANTRLNWVGEKFTVYYTHGNTKLVIWFNHSLTMVKPDYYGNTHGKTMKKHGYSP